MRERALEDWIEKWIIQLEYEQSVLNPRYLDIEFQDFLKEHIGKKLTDQAMEDAVEISTEKTKIKGNLICLRRKAKV
jgi:benzoyl-CoA reductase/2-hydroxyglutaryl-CoA dehydratase subunit BcrC/BadD/HgdB